MDGPVGQQRKKAAGSDGDGGLDQESEPGARDHMARAEPGGKDERRKSCLVGQLGDEDYGEARCD